MHSIGLSFRFCFRFRQSGFQQIVNDRVTSSTVRRKWKCSDSSDSHSIVLMTVYNSNFLFSQGHKCSYDSTSLAILTLTPSLVKSSLKTLGFYNFCYSTAQLNTIIKKNTFSSKSLSCCLKGHQVFFVKFNAVITVNTFKCSRHFN